MVGAGAAGAGVAGAGAGAGMAGAGAAGAAGFVAGFAAGFAGVADASAEKAAADAAADAVAKIFAVAAAARAPAQEVKAITDEFHAEFNTGFTRMSSALQAAVARHERAQQEKVTELERNAIELRTQIEGMDKKHEEHITQIRNTLSNKDSEIKELKVGKDSVSEQLRTHQAAIVTLSDEKRALEKSLEKQNKGHTDALVDEHEKGFDDAVTEVNRFFPVGKPDMPAPLDLHQLDMALDNDFRVEPSPRGQHEQHVYSAVTSGESLFGEPSPKNQRDFLRNRLKKISEEIMLHKNEHARLSEQCAIMQNKIESLQSEIERLEKNEEDLRSLHEREMAAKNNELVEKNKELEAAKKGPDSALAEAREARAKQAEAEAREKAYRERNERMDARLESLEWCTDLIHKQLKRIRENPDEDVALDESKKIRTEVARIAGGEMHIGGKEAEDESMVDNCSEHEDLEEKGSFYNENIMHLGDYTSLCNKSIASGETNSSKSSKKKASDIDKTKNVLGRVLGKNFKFKSKLSGPALKDHELEDLLADRTETDKIGFAHGLGVQDNTDIVSDDIDKQAEFNTKFRNDNNQINWDAFLAVMMIELMKMRHARVPTWDEVNRFWGLELVGTLKGKFKQRHRREEKRQRKNGNLDGRTATR